MNQSNRNKLLENSESLPELLGNSCNVSMDEGRKMESRINTLEKFFSDYSSGKKPRKMAFVYVFMRKGIRPPKVAQLCGETDSPRDSLSADLGKSYLEDIKEIINDKVNHDEKDGYEWTPGDKVYEPNEDPLREYFDIVGQGRNAKLGSF